MDIEELLQLQRQLYGLLRTNRGIDFEAGDQHRSTYLHDTKQLHFTPINATTYTPGCDGGAAHKWRLYLRKTVDNALAPSAVWGFLSAEGDCFLGAFDIPFDYPDESFMLDTKLWTDVDLVVEAAAAGISTIVPEIGVVLEEVIP